MFSMTWLYLSKFMKIKIFLKNMPIRTYFLLQEIIIEIMVSHIPLSFTDTILNFPKLKKFEFSTNNTLIEFESFRRFFESSPNLEEITLNIFQYSQEQFLELLENISMCCPFLKKLSIEGNSEYETDVQFFTQLTNLQHLEILTIKYCVFKTYVLYELHMNGLKELHISFESVSYA